VSQANISVLSHNATHIKLIRSSHTHVHARCGAVCFLNIEVVLVPAFPRFGRNFLVFERITNFSSLNLGFLIVRITKGDLTRICRGVLTG
jgi:hypothetical protein